MPKGGSSSTVNVHNDPVDVDTTVEVNGLDNIKLTLQPSPLKTESKTEFVLPQPLKSELILPQPLKSETKLDTQSNVTSDSKSALSVDLKPVALDVCLNTSSKLPQGQIHQPFSFQLGFTLFGLDVFGLKFGGDSRIVMSDLPKRPAVDWPAQQNARPSEHPSGVGAKAESRGLRVRIK
jgi:hypothetical protein